MCSRVLAGRVCQSTSNTYKRRSMKGTTANGAATARPKLAAAPNATQQARAASSRSVLSASRGVRQSSAQVRQDTDKTRRTTGNPVNSSHDAVTVGKPRTQTAVRQGTGKEASSSVGQILSGAELFKLANALVLFAVMYIINRYVALGVVIGYITGVISHV